MKRMFKDKAKKLFISVGAVIISLFIITNCPAQNANTISLAGKWSFKIDREDVGILQKYFESNLDGSILLPGSMVQNNLGDDVTLDTHWTGSIYDSSWYFNPRMAKYRTPGNLKFPFFLTPNKRYVGAAWYQKTVDIPANWTNKHITLFLERAHWQTKVWVDNKAVGERNSLSAPQVYDLTKELSKGIHRITIRVDNRIHAINPGQDSHSITDQTQGDWNGIVGKIVLEAVPEIWIKQIQTFPDLENHLVRVKLFIHNNLKQSETAKVTLSANSFNSPENQKVAPISQNIHCINGDEEVTIDYPMGKDFLAWNEFHPALYHLNVQLISNQGEDNAKTDFGMRSFKINGTRFAVNGVNTFLRGTVENCDFPITGYAPMDVPSWQRVFKIAKSYGLNEMRFHSYCPPEAAFEAADLEGFYLHVEGPSWANHGSSLGDGKPIDQYIYDETNRIDDAYGNHPSFCMMAYGNEPRGGHQAAYLNKFVDYWVAKDSRHVYTGASTGMSWPWVNQEQFIVRSGPRGLNWATVGPNTLTSFYDAIKDHPIPYISHEVGQYCAFPDFTEIKKYTGVHKAKNFELFQQDLKDHFMGDQAHDFLMSSGKLQLLCYKGEIEKALRTPGFAGFELLGLNDYSGQGTALVGVLNVFWQSKGYVDADQFKAFSGSVVPLALIPKFVYKNNEQFKAAIQIANFGEGEIKNAHPQWQLTDEQGQVVANGALVIQNIPIGNAIALGEVNIPLSKIAKAAQLRFSVSLKGTSIKNSWNIWVYPNSEITQKDSSQIYFCHELNGQATEALKQGKKVLLLCAGKVQMGKDVAMHFLPVFWNTSWFKMRPPHTTGIYLNPADPAFKYFPTEDFSDFQWWSLVNKQQVMWLKDFPHDFRPLVQPIDTWFLNRRLGLIFEAKVGNGRLMVCSADLSSNLNSRPAARQLLYSLTKYMESKDFKPKARVDLEVIQNLFKKQISQSFNTYSHETPDELKPRK
ncbi:exo-beta-1,4-galactosidase [Arachidicoccus sp.]|uniref:exo-beta-1,4-galactosidase n=1 Tax=Arachidicoccus sp. TaxID=1872624 RepID=UPI003D24CF35